jgi:hypothetical protein
MAITHKKQLVVKARYYQLITRNLYKLGIDGILRGCVLEPETPMILEISHDGTQGGQYVVKETTQNILCMGLWWPTLHMETKEYCQSCDVFQRVGRPL